MTVKIVAECGVNWEKSDHPLDIAQQMIFAAKEAGATGVKFQLFNEQTIKDSPLKDRLSKLILTEQNVADLHEHAKRIGLEFVLTPMYSEAVDIAAKYADLIKIRYADHENTTLIDKAKDTGKTLLISIPRPPLNVYDPHIYWMYCIPKYPPEPEDFNLEYAAICNGFSSHFPYTVLDLAFAINRFHEDVYIEKHVMLSIAGAIIVKEVGAEVQHPIDEAVSITFDELKTFIKQLQLIDRIKRIRL
jgi:sialic acid synthase SpsE